MLSILRYFNFKSIDPAYVVIFLLGSIMLNYFIENNIVTYLLFIDIYIFLYMTCFKINNSKFKKIPHVKMDITREGVEKEKINLESLIEDYSKKFSSK